MELLETPKLMDKDEKEVKEEDALKCKVTHNILRPDMCLVMDKVGGRTNQKGDGNVGVRFPPSHLDEYQRRS